MPVQKATIVSRGQALGYTLNVPSEDRYLHTKEELSDMMKVYLAGRAAEFVVFGRVTNGAANDLERVTGLARSMVFEYGMADEVVSRTMRADNYALSEETKRVRDQEQAHLTDEAYKEAVRLLHKHRASLDRVAQALLEKETLDRASSMSCSGTSCPSRAPPRPSGCPARSPSPTRPVAFGPWSRTRKSWCRSWRRRPRRRSSCGLLRSNGIDCYYRDTQAIDSPLEDFTAAGAREIVVRAADAEAAKELLAADPG